MAAQPMLQPRPGTRTGASPGRGGKARQQPLLRAPLPAPPAEKGEILKCLETEKEREELGK